MSDNQLVEREVSQVEVFNTSLPVTQSMLDQLKNQRALLSDFVSSQLKKDVDYGIIKGTKKNSLYKPGAEKLRGLFGLRIELNQTNRILDIEKNFAMFTYKATVYRGHNVIAECEGATNSQEQRYKERSVWRDKTSGVGKEKVHEVTPVCDILNTLMKMAQKRAFVGAIILAVGASDFFTQDIDEPEDAENIGVIPKTENKNQVPGVTGVGSIPKQNNQTGKMVIEACVSYDDRALASGAGFTWNKVQKKWLKEVTQEEFAAGFNFPTQEV